MDRGIRGHLILHQLRWPCRSIVRIVDQGSHDRLGARAYHHVVATFEHQPIARLGRTVVIDHELAIRVLLGVVPAPQIRYAWYGSSRSLGEPHHSFKDFRTGRAAVNKLSHPRADVVFSRWIVLVPVDLVVVGELRVQPSQPRVVVVVGLVQDVRVLVPIVRSRRGALGNTNSPNRLSTPILIRWSGLVEQQLDPIAIAGVDRIERRGCTGQHRVGVDIGRSRCIELQKQRALGESILIKAIVSLTDFLARSIVDVGVPEPLVMECQRFGQKQFRLLHPKNHADVLTHIRINGVVAVVAGIDQSIRCPVRWPIQRTTPYTKWIDVVLEAGHRRIGVAEIHHVDCPLCQGSGSKLVLDELIRDLFHAREEMISGDNQLSQTIQIACQELPGTEVDPGR